MCFLQKRNQINGNKTHVKNSIIYLYVCLLNSIKKICINNYRKHLKIILLVYEFLNNKAIYSVQQFSFKI